MLLDPTVCAFSCIVYFGPGHNTEGVLLFSVLSTGTVCGMRYLLGV